MKKALVIYHKDDNDGVISGVLLHLYYAEVLKIETIDHIGVDYNDLKSFDSNKIKELYDHYDYLGMTDISMPIEMMRLCYDLWGDNYIWIDHHAPVIKAANEAGLADIKGIRDSSHSALYHAWIFLQNALERHIMRIPDFINDLSQWDSFTFTAENKIQCHALNKGVTALLELDFNRTLRYISYYIEHPKLFYTFYDVCFNTGKNLLDDEKSRMNSIIERNGDFNWVINNAGEHRKACAIFVQGATNSTMFEKADNGEIKCGIVFKHNADSSWSVSLYNVNQKYDDEFHVGNFCREQYNGGGHTGAGGFVISENQFIQILKLRTL